MKSKLIKLLLIIIAILSFKVSASENVKDINDLNHNIVLDNNIYVQHDENNKDIYLLNSEGEYTTIYQIINVKYAASKMWTRDGLYIDDIKGIVNATSKEDYVSVSEGEIYFVRLYGIGDLYYGENGNEWHITSPIVYFDKDDNCIGYELSSTFSASKKGVEITIPKDAVKMYISNYNNQKISIQKKLILTKSEFDEIKNTQNEILNYVDNNYEDIEENPVIYDEFDKGYITFVNDDSRNDVDKFADLFISKNVPLCYAAVYDNLLNNASNLKETRLETALRVQENGGEILAHNELVITENTINDTNFMYNYFVVQKKLLNSAGLDVNGIILSGGEGQIAGSDISAKWASAVYKYSDLLGEKYNGVLGNDSVYYHSRVNLAYYQNDIEKIKEVIDDAIGNNKWTVFYFHDTNEISIDVLNEVLDYINSKNKDEVEIVNYSTMYEKFAKREQTILNDRKTYYVSSKGTSSDGTDINNPINIEQLNKKTIKSGDTILFKSGDVFFDTISFKTAIINDLDIIISNYGEGELPKISTYKYISDDWEKYAENIYRINLVDNSSGYEKNDNNSLNVGYLESDMQIKYYNKKSNINELSNDYDFYSDENKYLYMYLNDNPYDVIGNLKVVVKSNLMNLSSNMNISNLNFSYTGGHALLAANSIENVKISNCIIENIGGSYLHSSTLNDNTRYGNGIEFYNSFVENVTITNNIFRNIYDVAFTIQGTKGYGKDISVYNNVFINNSQDSEIWQSEDATGIFNYNFFNNLSINTGRGWGYFAREDKYASASILFWNYEIEDTKINFNNNVFYNPRQIYYFSVTADKYFLTHDTINSNFNTFYLTADSTLYRNNWNYNAKEEFIQKYGLDENSTFNLIDATDYVTNLANKLDNINEIRLLVLNKEDVIKNVEFENIPAILEIEKGSQVMLDNYYIEITYQDGLIDRIKVNSDMLSDIDYELEKQIVTINYLGYKKSFVLEIKDKNIIEDDINNKKENIEEKTNDTANNESKDNKEDVLDNLENSQEVINDSSNTDKKEEINKPSEKNENNLENSEINENRKDTEVELTKKKKNYFSTLVLIDVIIFIILITYFNKRHK